MPTTRRMFVDMCMDMAMAMPMVRCAHLLPATLLSGNRLDVLA